MSARIRLVAAPGDLEDDVCETLDEMDSCAFGGNYLYQKKGSYWWIAYDGALPVGYAGMTPFGHLDCGFLCRVAVAVSHRRKGLHRRFIRVRERMIRSLGLSRSVTYVEANNVGSANNLIKSGYRLYRPVYHYGVAGALYFEKGLN